MYKFSNPTENGWNTISGGVIVPVVIFVYKQLISSSNGKTKGGPQIQHHWSQKETNQAQSCKLRLLTLTGVPPFYPHDFSGIIFFAQTSRTVNITVNWLMSKTRAKFLFGLGLFLLHTRFTVISISLHTSSVHFSPAVLKHWADYLGLLYLF